MPELNKKPNVPRQINPKRKIFQKLEDSSTIPRLNSRDNQDGIRPNNSMRRVQTLNGPLVENSNMRHLDGMPRRAESRSVRFGGDQVKEFVRESNEIRYEKEIEKINNRVILTQQKSESESIPDNETEEELEQFELPTYKSYIKQGLPSEEDHSAEPTEIMDRLSRLRSLADNILNVNEILLRFDCSEQYARRESLMTITTLTSLMIQFKITHFPQHLTQT